MKLPYTNTTNAPQYIGPLLIQAGDTRMVDSAFLPPQAEAAKPAAPEDPLLALLDSSVATIKDALRNHSDADLDRLEAGETAGKTRKGVQAAIAEERLNRSSAVGEVADAIAQIAEAPDALLVELVAKFDSEENPLRFNRPFRAAAEAELLKRGLKGSEGA